MYFFIPKYLIRARECLKSKARMSERSQLSYSRMKNIEYVVFINMMRRSLTRCVSDD